MPSVGYINPLEQLARSNMEMNSIQQDNSFALQLMNLAITGYGDSATARYLIAVTANQIGYQRERYNFLVDQVKEDKKSFGKAWDLLKDG